MKILMMVMQFPPAPSGGAENQCLRQARALAARGHEVTVVTPWLALRSRRKETIDGVVVRRLGCLMPLTAMARRWHDRLKPRFPGAGTLTRRPRADSKAPRKRFRWMSLPERPGRLSFLVETSWAVKSGRIKADVVHVHESNWLAGFANWLAEAMGVPVFCKEASQPVLSNGYAPDTPWAQVWCERRLKCRFIAMTDGIASDLETAGISGQQIVKIPNGVEIPAEAADPARNSDAIYVGNFTQGFEWKGFDVLFQAWGQAHRREPGMRLHLYGRGDWRPWAAYAEEQGCGGSVLFEGETGDVWAAHRRSGFMILPSRREGLSNALLEAMASGLPAVVSDLPGNLAVVEDGKNGIVVPMGDVDRLAAAMVDLYRSPEWRVRMGRAARARMEERFAMGKVAEMLESAYRGAIGSPCAGPVR